MSEFLQGFGGDNPGGDDPNKAHKLPLATFYAMHGRDPTEEELAEYQERLTNPKTLQESFINLGLWPYFEISEPNYSQWLERQLPGIAQLGLTVRQFIEVSTDDATWRKLIVQGLTIEEFKQLWEYCNAPA